MSVRLLSGVAFAMVLSAGLCAEDAQELNVRKGLPNVAAKLSAGGDVRVAYLGGSITEAGEGWRSRSLAWLQAQYPKAKLIETNAALGGTGSSLGVFRLRPEVLNAKPDLLFVEFCVNDNETPPLEIERAMEGIVRQTWAADPRTDIVFVYTLYEGWLEKLRAKTLPGSAAEHEKIAAHYGIPSIQFGLEVVKRVDAGTLVMRADPKTPEEQAALAGKAIFSHDGVHPLPESGHTVYMDVLQRTLPQLLKAGSAGPHALPAPLVADNYEHATLVSPEKYLSAGWKPLPSGDVLAVNFARRTRGIFRAEQPGEAIAFKFKGSTVGIMDLVGPDTNQYQVQIDAQPPRQIQRFDVFCQYHRLSYVMLASGLPDTVHSVKISLAPEKVDKAKIMGEKFAAEPARYAGNNGYVCWLMVIGEME